MPDAIKDAVYYEYDTSTSDFVTQLSYDMKMLTCPAVVKVIGEGTETDSENNITVGHCLPYGNPIVRPV